jgi:hypothetical protein
MKGFVLPRKEELIPKPFEIRFLEYVQPMTSSRSGHFTTRPLRRAQTNFAVIFTQKNDIEGIWIF